MISRFLLLSHPQFFGNLVTFQNWNDLGRVGEGLTTFFEGIVLSRIAEAPTTEIQSRTIADIQFVLSEDLNSHARTTVCVDDDVAVAAAAAAADDDDDDDDAAAAASAPPVFGAVTYLKGAGSVLRLINRTRMTGFVLFCFRFLLFFSFGQRSLVPVSDDRHLHGPGVVPHGHTSLRGNPVMRFPYTFV